MKQKERRELFAERLKIVCEIRHISGAGLAAKVGITQQAINYYFHAERMPNFEILDRISEALDVSPAFLLGYADPK